ncbi:tyrosinase family protein [Pokkaliibacter sp. CJK22405]|uniref:tyrosinase family protein n=1 Tax=Pokkaliibacter sp. CJK22405 TaxID=3384615 RepID=UPI003984ED7E
MPQMTRRDFIVAGSLAAASLSAPRLFAAPKARYTRYSVTSPEGQAMLKSYQKGVEAMLNLPATDHRNWFRYAFIHMMDCPHGNWWFYVWHRGYIGYFEQIIRDLSGNPEFTLPFWDWTETPEIPAGMFEGVLTPTNSSYSAFTGNLQKFTDFVKAPLSNYWNTLTPSQLVQQKERGYSTFDDLWNSVIGYDPGVQGAIAGNMAYVNTCGARYLSADNPKLDPKTSFDVSPLVVTFGLSPETFYSSSVEPIDPSVKWMSFASSKTDSHTVSPGDTTKFSVLEGFPHNKVHNYIGGVGPVSPGPFGFMTNFLSPVDPIFFLHHANMDRLWDVWERQQLAAGRNPQPTIAADKQLYDNEPFQFYVDSKGEPVGRRYAKDYLDKSVFGYDYGPGFGDRVQPLQSTGMNTMAPVKANIMNNEATLSLPSQAVMAHQQAKAQLVVEIVLPRPTGNSSQREFDILVNAPDDVTEVFADSPYYAGTIAFFGPPMHGMHMAQNASFHIALPQTLLVMKNAAGQGSPANLKIRLVPSHAPDKSAASSPVLNSVILKTIR